MVLSHERPHLVDSSNVTVKWNIIYSAVKKIINEPLVSKWRPEGIKQSALDLRRGKWLHVWKTTKSKITPLMFEFEFLLVFKWAVTHAERLCGCYSSAVITTFRKVRRNRNTFPFSFPARRFLLDKIRRTVDVGAPQIQAMASRWVCRPLLALRPQTNKQLPEMRKDSRTNVSWSESYIHLWTPHLTLPGMALKIFNDDNS